LGTLKNPFNMVFLFWGYYFHKSTNVKSINGNLELKTDA